jgi:MYXO-CTERM domain-containing protein
VTIAAASDLYVIPGPDWAVSLQTGLYYGTGQVTIHPQYDGNVNSPYDIALVRFLGATPTTPVIPALSATDDALAVGSTFTLVGFGKTDTGTSTTTSGSMNTARREVARTVKVLTAAQFQYDQTDLKGACSGDSGGPALMMTNNGMRVAGLTSFGDPACSVEGVSVRVSSAASLIQSFIAGAPTALDCDECTLASVGPDNTCVAQGEACGDTASSCGKFLACAGTCSTSSCANSCASQFSAGAAAYDAMIKCQCGACSTECTHNVNCGGTPLPTTCGGVTDPRPACAACIQAQCCADGTTCEADPICSSCLDPSTSNSTCHLSSTFTKLSQCIAGCAACAATTTGAAGSPSPTGAAGDANATGAAGAGAATSSTKSGCSCAIDGGGSLPTSGFLLFASSLVVALGRRRRHA